MKNALMFAAAITLVLCVPTQALAQEEEQDSDPLDYFQSAFSDLLTSGDDDSGTAADDSEYLGKLSSNPYDVESTSNPYGRYGSEYSPTSINNTFGVYGSDYSPKSVNNPYATETPKIFAEDGQYLGRLSSNPYDPESTSNPYGQYGSEHSPTSINNPHSIYGSPYSTLSPNNPYTLSAPIIVDDDDE